MLQFVSVRKALHTIHWHIYATKQAMLSQVSFHFTKVDAE